MRILILFFISIICGLTPSYGSSVCDKKICVTVEIVSKQEDMQRGLQGRDGLKENEGMLFVFKKNDFQSFWMKDMKFSIDMIWINEQKHIVTIAHSRPPCEKEPCEVYTPSQEARYVLEVPSGFSLKHNLIEGDLLEFNAIP